MLAGYTIFQDMFRHGNFIHLPTVHHPLPTLGLGLEHVAITRTQKEGGGNLVGRLVRMTMGCPVVGLVQYGNSGVWTRLVVDISIVTRGYKPTLLKHACVSFENKGFIHT